MELKVKDIQDLKGIMFCIDTLWKFNNRLGFHHLCLEFVIKTQREFEILNILLENLQKVYPKGLKIAAVFHRIFKNMNRIKCDLVRVNLNDSIDNIEKGIANLMIRTYLEHENLVEEYEQAKLKGAPIFQITKCLSNDSDKNFTSHNRRSQVDEILFRNKLDEKMNVIIDTNLEYLEYERFCIDDRNSKKCYCELIKPTLCSGEIWGCNFSVKSSHIHTLESYLLNRRVIDCVNESCSDCGYISENDLLFSLLSKRGGKASE